MKKWPDDVELTNLARQAADQARMPWEYIAVRVEKAIAEASLDALQIWEEYAQEHGLDELDEKQKREALLLAALRPG